MLGLWLMDYARLSVGLVVVLVEHKRSRRISDFDLISYE
jgi:hypothetical protein